MGRIRLGTIAVESSPPAGQVSFYAKTDENLYLKNPSGNEFQLIHSGVPGACGYFLEIIEISPAESIAKEVILADTPNFPLKTLVDVDGGGAAFYTLDFTVTGNVLSWAGGRLDGLLGAGDKLRVVYF
jgi:hypothetical protein